MSQACSKHWQSVPEIMVVQGRCHLIKQVVTGVKLPRYHVQLNTVDTCMIYPCVTKIFMPCFSNTDFA